MLTQKEKNDREKAVLPSYRTLRFLKACGLWLIWECINFVVVSYDPTVVILKSLIAVVYLPIVLALLPQIFEDTKNMHGRLSRFNYYKAYNLVISFILCILYLLFWAMKISFDSAIASCSKELTAESKINCIKETEDNRYKLLLTIYYAIK